MLSFRRVSLQTRYFGGIGGLGAVSFFFFFFFFFCSVFFFVGNPWALQARVGPTMPKMWFGVVFILLRKAFTSASLNENLRLLSKEILQTTEQSRLKCLRIARKRSEMLADYLVRKERRKAEGGIF
jgi:hypothetical protein